MGRRDRLKRDLLAGRIPTDAPIGDVEALYREAGWSRRDTEGSHYHFVKEHHVTITVTVHGGKANKSALKDLARALREAEGE